jgi:hypothetical protein
MKIVFELLSGRQLSMEGYSVQNVMEGFLEGDPNHILSHTLSNAAKSLGYYGLLIIPEGYEKFKYDQLRTEVMDPIAMMESVKMLCEFPRFMVSATLLSGPTAKSEKDTDRTRINLGFFCEQLPPDIGSVLPPILETLDWEQHAKDFGV